MTFRQLKEKLASLTEEQLDLEVQWAGEMRCGYVVELWVADEDHINPSGDGAEPISLYREVMANAGETVEEIEKNLACEEVVVKKGQPQLLVD